MPTPWYIRGIKDLRFIKPRDLEAGRQRLYIISYLELRFRTKGGGMPKPSHY